MLILAVLCTLAVFHEGLGSEVARSRQRRIVNGSPTGKNEWPMMAGLYSDSLGMVFCGGTIISTKNILTAAHCVKTRRATELAVLVGTNDVNDRVAPAALIRVSAVTPHPKFSGFQYDIALVTLQNPITFNDVVSPACLPWWYPGDSLVYNSVTMLGWGLLDAGGQKPTILQQTQVDVVDDSVCAASYPEAARNLCTYSPGRGPCQFDSGGPALYGRTVVGIISGGVGCGGQSPDLNTKVNAYIDWIQEVAPGDTYC